MVSNISLTEVYLLLGEKEVVIYQLNKELKNQQIENQKLKEELEKQNVRLE